MFYGLYGKSFDQLFHPGRLDVRAKFYIEAVRQL